MDEKRFLTRKLNGEAINLGDGIVPVIKELERGKLAIIGTGFYLTRYGLFMTANHVAEEFRQDRTSKLVTGFIMHLADDDKIYLRRILTFNMSQKIDLAIGHADNYMKELPQKALMNIRPKISIQIPSPNSKLVTYAYPENEILDRANKDSPPVIRGDYYAGKFLHYVEKPENRSMPCGYYETSIEIRSGASGGPVFDHKGRIVGVNCRGWDFRGSEHEGDPLSYVVPIGYALQMPISNPQVPVNSWELKQIPQESRKKEYRFGELIAYGHIIIDPPRKVTQ